MKSVSTIHKLSAGLMAVCAATALTACSSDDNSTGTKSSASSAQSAASDSAQAGDTATAPELPAAADLNAVLMTATDQNAPQDKKVATVQGGETAPQLFDTMAASKAESGATFEVVDPVLPGYSPDSVLATVNFTVPNQAPQSAENVEFVYENGAWKLSQSWACTLITNTVPPEQVPAMCTDGTVKTNDSEVKTQ